MEKINYLEVLKSITSTTTEGKIFFNDEFKFECERYIHSKMLRNESFGTCSCIEDIVYNEGESVVMDNLYLDNTLLMVEDLNSEVSTYIKMGCRLCGIVQFYDFSTFYDALQDYLDNEVIFNEKVQYLSRDKLEQLERIIIEYDDKNIRQDKLNKFIDDNIPNAVIIKIPKNTSQKKYNEKMGEVVQLFRG